jgi:hypothetical protein
MSDLFDPCGAMRPPSPPRELRERVLHAARHAALRSRETLSWSRLDLAWAGALLVLLACHAALSLRGSTTSPTPLPVHEARESLPAGEPDQDWLTFGFRLDAGRHQQQPGLTLAQALREVS